MTAAKKLSENFCVREFACSDGSDTVKIDLDNVAQLQKIRDHFCKAITITSGYRTASYNKKIKGATKSYHMTGQAADIVIKGVDPLKVDWNSGTKLDNDSNLYDTSTVLGAMRYGIKTLLTAFPHLRVYVFTPCYRDMLGENKDQTSDTYRNATTNLLLSEVGDAIELAAKSMGIPCKNMYYCSNLNEYTRDAYMSDGTHRNAAGYELLGKQYAKFVLAN